MTTCPWTTTRRAFWAFDRGAEASGTCRVVLPLAPRGSSLFASRGHLACRGFSADCLGSVVALHLGEAVSVLYGIGPPGRLSTLGP